MVIRNMDLQKNADRFTGFANTYEAARPKMPLFPVEVICRYLGKMPETVVDLGAGTGLSALVWKDYCQTVIGVEPSDDMIAEAKKKENEHLTFIQAFANKTGLPDRCADAAVCSQSFHWMEPQSTLAEVGRILKLGGIFATVDCDWPPVYHWEAELKYSALFQKIARLEREDARLSGNQIKWDKAFHLKNIKECGLFRYTREILFSNREEADTKRMIDLMYSQGGLQNVLRHCPEQIEAELQDMILFFQKTFGDRQFEIDFSYRMRIGIK